MLNATDGSEDHLIKVQGCDDCSSWWRRLWPESEVSVEDSDASGVLSEEGVGSDSNSDEQ
jgi:formate dehydrogenase maturation protein FdhE